MPWGPEDWDAVLLRDAAGVPISSAPLDTLEEILTRIPDPGEKTLGDLGRGLGARLPWLAARFRKVVPVGHATCGPLRGRRGPASRPVARRRGGWSELDSLRATLDVAVAILAIPGPRATDVDLVLEQVRGTLVEGGILVATFPALPRSAAAFELRLGKQSETEARPRFHEVELQYRLRRAGFRGVRIRRCNGDEARQDTLVCMAVRRANN